MSARDEILGRVRAALSDVDPPQETDVPPAPRRTSTARTTSSACSPSGSRTTARSWSGAPPRDLEARVRAALPPGGRVVVPPGLGIDVPGAVVDDGWPPPSWTASRRSSPRPAWASPRPAPSCSTTSPTRAAAPLSLVPDHHVCVVRADQVVPDVPDAVALLDASRPLTWISGPSATSDIELDRVEGVHGPRVPARHRRRRDGESAHLVPTHRPWRRGRPVRGCSDAAPR